MGIGVTIAVIVILIFLRWVCSKRSGKTLDLGFGRFITVNLWICITIVELISCIYEMICILNCTLMSE